MQCYRFKRENADGGKPIAFLYKLGILLFKDRLFLITSDGSSDETGTISTHKHIQQTINKQYTKQQQKLKTHCLNDSTR
jgi:hypothetical protein